MLAIYTPLEVINLKFLRGNTLNMQNRCITMMSWELLLFKVCVG